MDDLGGNLKVVLVYKVILIGSMLVRKVLSMITEPLMSVKTELSE